MLCISLEWASPSHPIRIRLALWEAGFPTTNSDRCPLADAIATCSTRRLSQFSQLTTNAAFCIVLISVWSNCTLGIGFDAKQTRWPGCAGSYGSHHQSGFCCRECDHSNQTSAKRDSGFSGRLWSLVPSNPGGGKLPWIFISLHVCPFAA